MRAAEHQARRVGSIRRWAAGLEPGDGVVGRRFWDHGVQTEGKKSIEGKCGM